MNWLKKIFQNKTENKVAETPEIGVPSEKTNQSNSATQITVQSRFAGFDYTYIDLVHFKNDEAKSEYIETIKMIISELEIKDNMDYVAVQKKLADYNSNSGNSLIPLFTNTLLFKSFIVTKLESDGIAKISERPSDTNQNGAEKIKSYYPALNFCTVNLARKVKNNFFDFQFEEKLISEILEKNNLFNYARIDTLFALGNAYYKATQLSKMDSTFEKILSEKYDLSESTIANYYRSIGEIYADLKQDEKALNWLKAGLTLNTKLGVKKLVDQLEKNLSK